jgi:putative membrane protein
MKIIYSTLTNIIAIYVASVLVSSVSYHNNFWILALAGLVFGLVNMLVRPIVIILTLPAVILSLGLVIFVINALMLLLTSAIVPDFHVGGFWSALLAAIIVSLVNLLLQILLKKSKVDPRAS